MFLKASACASRQIGHACCGDKPDTQRMKFHQAASACSTVAAAGVGAGAGIVAAFQRRTFDNG
jgi:hypothetical protein